MKMFQKIQELIDDKDALVCVLIDEVFWISVQYVFIIDSEVHKHWCALPYNACKTRGNCYTVYNTQRLGISSHVFGVATDFAIFF